MNVYLVRHAIAVARDPAGELGDGARPLTAKGKSRMRRIGRALRRLRVGFDEIWTSPLIRALETADLLAECTNFTGKVRAVEALQPGGVRAAVIGELQGFAGESVALVGHQPDLSELAAQLISGQASAAIDFKKGGVACIAVDTAAAPLRGTLRWLLTPSQLRLLA